MSYCRITGRSRGLPKPNYFPLLPPISPADAKRFCRITGKSYGLPTHHYIPVLLGVHSPDKSKCKITNASRLGPHRYTAGLILGEEKKKHVILKDYRYVFPVLEGEGEQQRALRDLLSAKQPAREEEDMKFVYTVEERRCSLVFPSRLEAAVRDGDVRDVMLSRDCDTVLLRLKQGKNVSVDFRNLEDFDDLYDGLGPREDVLEERERLKAEARRRKRKRQAGLNYARKIFEEKERDAEKEEELRRAKQLKLRSLKEEITEKQAEDWKRVNLEKVRMRACELVASLNVSCGVVEKGLDWSNVAEVTKNVEGTPIVDKMPVPLKIEPQTWEPSSSKMLDVTSSMHESTVGFEAISVVDPLIPLQIQPDPTLEIAIANIPEEDLKATSNVNLRFLQGGEEALEDLPRAEEIPELLHAVQKAEKTTMMRNTKGLKLQIDSAERFVIGQMVQTPTGPVFVPGQTLETPQGPTFVPGFTVNTPKSPALIAGRIINVDEPNGKGQPVFVAGQTLQTPEGQRFLQGQNFHGEDNVRFVEGQTVLTEDGPKFVAGQIMTNGNFVPGQTIFASGGAKFVPGQTITDHRGESFFVPGQSVQMNGNWQFVQGQCVETPTGAAKFVPGKTISTIDGPTFLPGQFVVTESGESCFVPGIEVEDDSTGKEANFVPGMTLKTPKGSKFVAGQIMNTSMGERFVAGITSLTDKGFQFAAAHDPEEAIFAEAGPIGIPIDPRVVNVGFTFTQSEIFGHMVQTELGVEFVAENARKLPEGKRIVPGQLVRDGKEGPRFVPGVMTEDGFLPGQTVMTEKGERFVPGQVIDTSEGPKFVPGRMVETRTGPKFVPGQTIDTVDGPRFVPGQIVDTKAGPTFIPGQVISTEDEGSRFVPGQVVDTADGPRFVPGRVVESGESGVIFVPGQIVQTEEGPRFVAPDLTDTLEGEMEFSVQGFEVTPEELRLLRPQNLRHDGQRVRHSAETSIDARMLRQLSEVGLSVGRKVAGNIPAVDVDVDPTAVALEHALSMATKLGLHGDAAIKMAQVISTIAHLAKNIVLRKETCRQEQFENDTDESIVVNGKEKKARSIVRDSKEKTNEESNDWSKEAVKTAMSTAILAVMANDSTKDRNSDGKQDDDLYSAISESFNVSLRRNSQDVEVSVDEMLRILLIPQNRGALCQRAMLEITDSKSNKVDILKSTVVGSALKDNVILDRLSMVLEEEHGIDLIGAAFRTVSRNDPELVSRVLRKVSEEVGSVATEKDATETVHKAIVQAVTESSEIRVKELLDDDDSNNVREMLLQAVGLARALGMSSTVNSLLAVISDEKSTRVLANDKITLDVLKRLTVMRQLAEERPPFANALGRLCSDPELARTDPRLRTLVRESAALMIVPEEAPLESSADVPTALLCADNSLAMEEFLFRRNHKPTSIFMILKQGLQAVVPREASRSVLTGEVAYSVLDEDGIRRFEPLHVFSALRLNRPTAHRFSMYCCPVAGEEDVEAEITSTYAGTISISSSVDGFVNGTCQKQSSNGVTLSRSDRSCGYSGSRENTPSFRRLNSIYQENSHERKSLENYIVVKDYTSESDGFSVNVGDIVEAIEYADPAKKMRIDPELDIGDVGDTLDSSAARHKLSIRPHRKYTDPRARSISRSSSDISLLQRVYVRIADGREGWLPMSILMQTALSEESSTFTSHHRPEDSHYRREAVIKELVETEEEFGRDLQLVVERYLKPLDNPEVPRAVRDNKEIIFTNLKQIADFHNTVLIEGVKYYADQPRMLGKTFLRLERDFDKHVAYCRDEPAAQEFLLMNDEVREYFEELSQTLGDDKSVSEHLKLPIQRINDYQLLLKELVKYSTRLGENCDDLQKALELMLGIPHRATDNKFISNIEGYKGNIHKLGRLLTHEWYTVIDKDGKSKERYLFLFKARILVCKVRRISEDRSVFVLKDIIRLPEVEVKDHPEDLRSFELHNPDIPGYPITLIAHKDPVKAYWLKEIRQYASDLVALAEHAADDLQLTEIPETKDEVKTQENPQPVKIESSKLETTKKETQRVEASKIEATKANSENPELSKSAVAEKNPENPGQAKPVAVKGNPGNPGSPKPESVKTSPGNPGPQKPELLKTDPGNPGPQKPETTRTNPGNPGPQKPEAAKTNPGNPEPQKPEAAKTNPGNPGPQKPEAAKTNPGNPGPQKPEAAKTNPGNPGPQKPEAAKTNPGNPNTKNPNPGPPKAEEQKIVEKKDTVPSEAKKAKVEEGNPNMSRRYSSSRYSASSKIVEEYSSVSSNRNGVSSYVESSSSTSAAVTASSIHGTEKISETSSSYKTATSGAKDEEITVESNTARIALSTTETGKPVFVKTIEGCNIEPSQPKKALIHAIAGEVATFECTLVQADASTQMQWLKDNKPLTDKLADRVITSSDEKTFKLQIQNVHESDSGIYIARAANGEGQATCTAQLVVQELTPEEKKARAEANAPIFLVRLKDTELLENTYLRFMIKVKGDPNPELKFYKDGVLIDSRNARVTIITEKADKGFYEMVISDVQKVDAGKYTCTAMNRYGEATCEATVTVTEDKPMFPGLPEGLLEPGEEPQFTWLRDGQPFDPEERFKVLFKDSEDTLALVFQHVKPEDAGLYTCVAQTSTGNISCSAELTVQGAVNQLLKDPEKPILQTESKQSEVSAGGSAMLDLQVKGYPKPDITWTKDGQEIVAGGRIKYLWEDEESLSLVIKNVTAKDAGIYTIRAKNELGEDSTQIELIVKSAPKITKKQADITAVVEETLTMVVQVEATPAPDVKWYKDGQLIQESERININKEGTDIYKIVIKNVRMDDAGSYSILARNEINQTTEMWNVTVKCPPKIRKRLGETPVANEGDCLTLLIEVDSDPEATVTWFKDGQKVVEDERIQIVRDGRNYMLKINGAIGTDAAIYSTDVTNNHGTVRDQTRLQVSGIPRFKTKLCDITANEGDVNIEFVVEIDGFPKPSVHWFLGDVEITEKRTEYTRIEEGDNYKLIIKEVKTELKGHYTCKVINEYGENKSSSEFVVNTKPKLIKKLADQRVKEGDTLKLTVEISGTPDPEVKWFKDGEEVSADARIKITRDKQRKESYDLTVTLVKGSDGGVYEVRAENDLGMVLSKSKVIVLTKTEETVKKVEEEPVTQKIKEEEVAPEKQHGEESGPEGRVTMEKQSIQVLRGGGDTITITVASTTTHEATSTGPDERHTISKMTATKVECHDLSSEGPIVEEVASYNYTLHEESSSKPQNGVLIEEYSDTSDHDKSKLTVNRGISIVSVSDDESTLKAISRDVSTDDMQCAELSEDLKLLNGTYEEFNDVNGKLLEEQLIDVKPQIGTRLTEMIIEEHSMEESISEKPIERVLDQSETPIVQDDEVLGPSSKEEVIFTPQLEKVAEEALNKSQKPVLQNGELSKQTVERINSVLENATVNEYAEVPQIATKDLSTLLKQESKLERLESETLKAEKKTLLRENSQKAVSTPDEEVDEELEALFNRVKRQRSVLDDILDKESEKVSAPPHIVSSNITNRMIFETQTVTFEVIATGLPRPDAKWFKDGKPLRSGERVRISNAGERYELELSKAILDDAGVYECVFTNKLGEDIAEGELAVGTVNDLRKPRFSQPLADVDVANGKNGEFKAVFTADPVPEMVWFCKGLELPANDSRMKIQITHKPESDKLTETTVTLKIPRCTKDDTGEYALKLENKWGEAESSAFLNLLLEPVIEEFKDTSAPVDERAEWVAIVKGNPKPVITWSKDGVELEKGTKYDMEEDRRNNTYKLIFKNVELEDDGKYTITAKNYLDEAVAQAMLKTRTEKPIFTKELTEVSISDREDVELKVRVSGIPKPKIKWLKDGITIMQDARHEVITHVEGLVDSTLFIKTFSIDDLGIVTCEASNIAGEATTSCKLDMVLTPPAFGYPNLPKSAQVDEGEPLVLKAKVGGSPIPLVTWYKDGEELVPDDHIKIENLPDGSTKLIIDNVVPVDSGAYKLVVKNTSGEQSSLCAVAVTPSSRSPTFSKPLEDTKAIIGQPLNLQAQVIAFPNPQVQWFKDGIPLRATKEINFINEPNGLIGLTIDKVQPEDAGTYSLIVFNKLGEITGAAKVEVEEKERRPDFIGSLLPLTVVENFPAKMEVKIVGKPTPDLLWLHNGAEIIPDGNHIKIISQPDGSHALIIDKATSADTGEYQVVASNTEGTASCKANLEVTGKMRPDMPEEKPGFLSPMRDISVEEGQPLIFSAGFVGNPIPDVDWTKDGEPLLPSERLMITCDGKKVGLEINPCEAKDTGTYSCRLTNPLGEDTNSAMANVRKIFQPPNFTQKFTDMQQMPSYDAKFLARISGLPKPDITWYFNDKPILRDDDKYKIKRDSDACCLYVKDCTYDDTGVYKCHAINKIGEAECTANLEVVDKIEKIQKKEPPTFLKRIGDCEVYKSMLAKFTACVTGNPEPEFEWYRNGDRLWPTDRIKMDQEGSLLRLSIGNVDEMDGGKYMLKIFNPYGQDLCEAEMIFESLEPRAKRPLADQYIEFDNYRKSGIPWPLADRPIISRMMDRHLTLSWKPSIPLGPRVPVTYLVEMCELPDGDWFTARTGIRSCVCDIRNLEPFRDYKFRIRVENKYGISDPSPFAQTYRAKLEPDPPKFFPYLPPGIDFRPETSPYFPKDFDIERPPHDGYSQAPKFLRQEHDTQYGVKNHNCNLFWFVYGYPKPKMTYYFNDELIQSGGRYDQSYTRNGQATLFINRMLERDAGMYEAVATNEHGEARQRVNLQIAEYPTFIVRPEEAVVMVRKSGQLMAKIDGVPYPEIKWYKDWKPLTSTTRIRIQFVEPDTTILHINEAIVKDEGLYSISARNVAGSVSCSIMLHVEENEHDYVYRTYKRKTDIKVRDKPFDEFYDLGDELGRGTQGITYHAVERATGRTYAAKVMHGRGDLKPFMYNEMDAMNQLNHRKLLRLHDAYESDKSFTLITELAAGGELADNLIRQAYYTEAEIAGYIRQLLWGLEYMHDNHFAHLSLTLGDLLISHSGGDDLKIGDFGLTRRISSAKLMLLSYGMPEYVAPEVTNNEGVSYSADMWSVGIITYILLSGISPFRGINDRETLMKIRQGVWDFDDRWKNTSNEAKDFIRRLLVYNVDKRMEIKAALTHPWLDYADKPSVELNRIPSEYLKTYYKLYRDWYGNASCRTWYRRRKLSTAFEHPSKMVYPPGHRFTPEPTIDRYSPIKKPLKKTWEDQIAIREPIDTEIGIIKSESHYQYGPDTYLLQLRDTDFPVRLREYMKVACNRSPGYSRTITEENGYDWRTPIIRERRRFTDVMDEEIDDERRARISRYGSPDTYTLRRLKHELGTRLDSYAEAEAMIESKKEGNPPFFREKPQIRPIEEGKPAQLVCLAVGDPKPLIQWFKNDIVIQETNRIKITEDQDDRSILSFTPVKEHDAGIYKVVARNSLGQTVARTRMVIALVPSGPDSPEIADVSDTEVLLRWKQPKYDGNSAVLCYNLQYKEGDSIAWVDVSFNIDHEFYLVRDLKTDTSYNFRLAARNRIGWSEKGIPSKLTKTRPTGVPKIQITSAMRYLQELTEAGQEIVLDEDKPHLDYSIEEKPLEWSSETPITNKYNFISEISRGQFSAVVKGVDKSSDRVIVAKILELRPEIEKQVNREFEALRSLRHERIALLEAAYKAPGLPFAVFILEKLQGADILTYFSSRHEYTENCVATAVTQILDALQYLHWRGYCHLDIQPDNIVMASVRSVQVKLVDMGAAQKVSRLGTVVPKAGHREYRAPEVYNEESAYPQTDIWMVGVLTYVLLSGVSPFRGDDASETRQNILFVRYRFEHLFKELSQEATRFLMQLFKRAPSKRPMAEECHEHRWLMPTDFMIKKRERAVFLGNRLKEYNTEYHEEKEKSASESQNLSSENLLGSTRKLIRSTSIQEELLTAV